jgi:hypothetical protein
MTVIALSVILIAVIDFTAFVVAVTIVDVIVSNYTIKTLRKVLMLFN